MTYEQGAIAQVPVLVARLYEIVGELERLFAPKRFTPDGHLVGSLGEVLAAHRYGLGLLPHSKRQVATLAGLQVKPSRSRSRRAHQLDRGSNRST